MSEDRLIRSSEIAKMVDRTMSTISKWRARYDDFPEAKLGEGTNHVYYSEPEFVNWYINHFPERAATLPRWLHSFEVAAQKVDHRVLTKGPANEVVGYLKAYRDIKYGEWVVTSSSDGFVARKDGTVHIIAMDTKEPDEWFVYEQRILASGRR